MHLRSHRSLIGHCHFRSYCEQNNSRGRPTASSHLPSFQIRTVHHRGIFLSARSQVLFSLLRKSDSDQQMPDVKRSGFFFLICLYCLIFHFHWTAKHFRVADKSLSSVLCTPKSYEGHRANALKEGVLVPSQFLFLATKSKHQSNFHLPLAVDWKNFFFPCSRPYRWREAGTGP